MRQSTYLNVILTVNAVLLAGLMWTQIASSPVLAEEAVAQSRTRPTTRVPSIPNAAEQRKKMIDALADLQRSVDATRGLLEGGGVKVQVTNLNEIEINTGG